MNDFYNLTPSTPWLPPLILSTVVAIVLVKLTTLFLLPSPVQRINFFPDTNKSQLRTHHVVVTGGSSGIGYSLALQLSKSPIVKTITLIARNEEKLRKAKIGILKELVPLVKPDTKEVGLQQIEVNTCSIDLSCTNSTSFNSASVTSNKIIAGFGPPTILLNCAGTSSAAPINDTPFEVYSNLMSANYLSCVTTIKLFLPSMVKNKNGRILITSSGAGQVGLFGYTAYSGSKFALRGLAESLHFELPPNDIFLTMAYPPNTNTPGFEAENVDKPEETRRCEGEGGLYKPGEIARAIISGIERGRVSCWN